MQLKDALKDFEANKGKSDFLSVYYEDENGKRENFGVTMPFLWEIEAKHPKRWALLLDCDVKRYEPTETEGTHWGGRSFVCTEYIIELDADQARIALERHPALTKPEPKTRKATKNRRRFTL